MGSIKKKKLEAACGHTTARLVKLKFYPAREERQRTFTKDLGEKPAMCAECLTHNAIRCSHCGATIFPTDERAVVQSSSSIVCEYCAPRLDAIPFASPAQ